MQCDVDMQHHSHNSSTRSEKLNYGNHTRTVTTLRKTANRQTASANVDNAVANKFS